MTGLSKELYEKGVVMGREADVIALLKDGRLQPKDIAEILGIPLEDVLALKEREGISSHQPSANALGMVPGLYFMRCSLEICAIVSFRKAAISSSVQDSFGFGKWMNRARPSIF